VTYIKASENGVYFLSETTIPTEYLQKVYILLLVIACSQTRICLQTLSMRISRPRGKDREDLWCHSATKWKI